MIIAKIADIISVIRIRARNARIAISIVYILAGMLTNVRIAVGMNGGPNAPIAAIGLMVMILVNARIVVGIRTAIRAAIRATSARIVIRRLTVDTIAIFAVGMTMAKREFAPIAAVS